MLDWLRPRQIRKSGHEQRRAAAHVPLPRITMSKSRFQREFSFCHRKFAAGKTVMRRGEVAVYRGAARTCQTQKRAFAKNFSRRCG